MLMVSFIAIFICSQIAYKLVNKYPPVDCESLVGYGDEELMLKKTFFEFKGN